MDKYDFVITDDIDKLPTYLSVPLEEFLDKKTLEANKFVSDAINKFKKNAVESVCSYYNMIISHIKVRLDISRDVDFHFGGKPHTTNWKEDNPYVYIAIEAAMKYLRDKGYNPVIEIDECNKTVHLTCKIS